MSHPAFLKLLEGFCQLTRIDRPEVVLEQKIVTVDGVVFSLVLEEDVPEWLFLYADFGPLPGDKALDVCKALLEANFFLFATRQQISFVISPNTSNMTLAFRAELNGMTPEALQSLLVRLAAQANAWRQGHFGDLKPVQQTVPSASGRVLKVLSGTAGPSPKR